MLILPIIRGWGEGRKEGKKVEMEGKSVTDKCVLYKANNFLASSIMYKTRKRLGMKNDCINCSIHWLPRMYAIKLSACICAGWSPTELEIHNSHTHTHIIIHTYRKISNCEFTVKIQLLSITVTPSNVGVIYVCIWIYII